MKSSTKCHKNSPDFLGPWPLALPLPTFLAKPPINVEVKRALHLRVITKMLFDFIEPYPKPLLNQVLLFQSKSSKHCSTTYAFKKCQLLPPAPAEHGPDPPPLTWEKHIFDQSQQATLHAALDMQRPVVAIHGPPGSGKTRILVEFLRVLSVQGKRVLVFSSTNAGFYHFAGQYCKLTGHRNFLSIRAFDRELAAKAVSEPETRRLIEERSIYASDSLKKKSFGSTNALDMSEGTSSRNPSAAERSQLSIERDWLAKTRKLRQFIQRNGQLVFANSNGATRNMLARSGSALRFDVVVLDDAQGLNELTSWWLAIPFAPLIRLFGDFHQPGEPVLSAIGRDLHLAESLLQRLDKEFGPEVNFHLRRQYRSNEAIQAWPNQLFYGPRAAEADPSVRHIRLVKKPGEEAAGEQFVTDPLVLVDLAKLEGEWRHWMFKPEYVVRSWRNWGEALLIAGHLRQIFNHSICPALPPQLAAYSTIFGPQCNLLVHLFAIIAPEHSGEQFSKAVHFNHHEQPWGQHLDVVLKSHVTVPPVKVFNDPYNLKFLAFEMCRARKQFIYIANSKWLEQGSQATRLLLSTFRERGRVIGPNELVRLGPGQFERIKVQADVEGHLERLNRDEWLVGRRRRGGENNNHPIDR